MVNVDCEHYNTRKLILQIDLLSEEKTIGFTTMSSEKLTAFRSRARYVRLIFKTLTEMSTRYLPGGGGGGGKATGT